MRTCLPPMLPMLRPLLVALSALFVLSACDSLDEFFGETGESTSGERGTGEGTTLPPDSGDSRSGPPTGTPGTRSGETTSSTGGSTVSESTFPTTETVPLTGFRMIYDAEGEGFFDRPWPTDARRTEAGTLDLTGFPQPRQIVRRYRDLLEAEVDGYSLMSSVFVRVEEAPEGLALGTPAESLRSDAPVYLMELGEGCGTRVPIELEIKRAPDAYLPPQVLVATPVPGFPMRPATPHALVVRRALGGSGDARLARPADFVADMEAAAAAEGPLAGLPDCLTAQGVDPRSVAVATVFTTADPTLEMQRLRDAVMDPQRTDAPALLHLEREAATSTAAMDVYIGAVELPIYQRGETPYGSSGGGIEWDAEGWPIEQRREEVEIAVAVPVGATSGPLLVWSDGTGATLRSPFRSSVVRQFVDAGFVVLSWVPQFHDGRAGFRGNTELSTFNFQNPEAGRSIFRQQAAEGSVMLRVARESLADFERVDIDTSRPVFGGHSQGALVGMMMAGVESEYAGYVVNGVGGYFANTIVERKDPVDFASLVGVASGVPAARIVRNHPVVQLAQLGSDAVDPLSYAHRWRGHEGGDEGVHIYITNGFFDDAVPYTSADALVLAGEVQPLPGMGWDPDPFELWPIEEAPGSIEGNTSARSGRLLSIGTWMDADEGHFAIYRSAAVRRSFVDFAVSLLEEDPPVIEVP